MADVAALSGVSQATVSRVVNGFHNVDPQTRAKVMDAINKLGYMPNRLAASLRTMKTNVGLVVIPDLGNSFFVDIIRGIEDVFFKRAYVIFVAETQNSLIKERELIARIRQQQVDFAIFLTARVDGEFFKNLSNDVPLVLACETAPGLSVLQVGIDNMKAAFEATQTLIQLGHRRIVHIAGSQYMQLSFERIRGYRLAMEQHGLQTEVHQGDFTFASGYNFSQQFAPDSGVTAVFAANDEMALGITKGLQQRGIRVPEDVSIMGFDDIPMSIMTGGPSLSTVSQPRWDIGRRAAELAVQENPMTNQSNVEILPHQIIMRETTRPI